MSLNDSADWFYSQTKLKKILRFIEIYQNWTTLSWCLWLPELKKVTNPVFPLKFTTWSWRLKYEERTFSTVCSLSELDEDNPICKGGRQEGGDEASIHVEEPTRWDVGPALQSSDQNLGQSNERFCFHHLFVMLFLRCRLFILKSCNDILCILCVPVDHLGPGENNYLALVSSSWYQWSTWHLCQKAKRPSRIRPGWSGQMLKLEKCLPEIE